MNRFNDISTRENYSRAMLVAGERERERDREINLGAIEIKILLNCCSFGRNMVETFVGDEKKKKICLYYHNWYRIGPVLYVHNTCIRIVFGFPSIRTLAIFNRYAKT